MSALSELSATDLRVLSAAIRSGRLRAPFSSLSVGRMIGAARGDPVSAALSEFVRAGASEGALALFLDTLVIYASRQKPLEDLVQVVTTGPEVLDGRDTAVVVQEMFRNAKSSVLVSGYKLHGAKSLFAELAARMTADAGLAVRMFFDIGCDGALSEADALLLFVRQFRKYHWPAERREPEVYYDPRTLTSHAATRAVLHAKCVVIDESELFVSSANFTEAAQIRNIEVGLLVRLPALSRQVTKFYEGLIRRGHLGRVPFPRASPTDLPL